MEEVLNDKPFFHAVVWACCNVFLKTFPGFRDCLVLELFKTGNPVSKSIGLAKTELEMLQSGAGRPLPGRAGLGFPPFATALLVDAPDLLLVSVWVAWLQR